MLNYCPHCGNKIQIGWNSCPFCGNSISVPHIPIPPPQPHSYKDYSQYRGKAIFFGVFGLFLSIIPIMGFIFGSLAIGYGIKSRSGAIALGIITILISTLMIVAIITVSFMS